ncbi:hypothetical protein HMPREF3291_16580 [Bacillus sp. HMSC76G11]|nr:hypothetical protein HMPREF3291_16580 [Bacillus sp. HMSC76G11]
MDAAIAVPAILIITQILKLSFRIAGRFLSSIAGVLGKGISIFISHPNYLASGIFMGFFYCTAQNFDNGLQRPIELSFHIKKTAKEAANVFKKQYLLF